MRDNYTCQYTGKKLDNKNADMDHIIPKSKGGKTVWTNVVISDKKINRQKANKTLEESGLKLIKKPVKPKRNFLFSNYIEKLPPSWKKFINYEN